MFVTPVGSHGIAYTLRGLKNMNQNSRIDLGAIGFPFFLYPAHSAFRIAQVATACLVLLVAGSWTRCAK